MPGQNDYVQTTDAEFIKQVAATEAVLSDNLTETGASAAEVTQLRNLRVQLSDAVDAEDLLRRQLDTAWFGWVRSCEGSAKRRKSEGQIAKVGSAFAVYHPTGVAPPVVDEVKPGPASRPSERDKRGQSLYPPKDKWHNRIGTITRTTSPARLGRTCPTR